MTILVDTNVLLRISDPIHPHRSIALGALERCRKSGHNLVLVPQVIYEFWVVATRPAEHNGFGLDAAEALKKTSDLASLFVLLRDERGIFDRWQALVHTHAALGKAAHDARLAAAMKRHGIEHLLTFNVRDFARHDGVTALQPEDVVSGKVVV